MPHRQRGQHHGHREKFHRQPKFDAWDRDSISYGRRRDGSEFAVEISLSPVTTDERNDGLECHSRYQRSQANRRRTAPRQRGTGPRKIRELSDSQNRLALIVDSSQDAIIGKNLDGIITHWNKGAEHIYGYTAQEMIGRPHHQLAPEESARTKFRPFCKRSAMASGSSTLSPTRHQRQAQSEHVHLGFAHLRRGGQNRGRVHDRPQHHGAEKDRRAVAAIAKDGGGRSPGRWSGPRLQ